MPRRIRTRKLENAMVASRPDAKHHITNSDTLCDQYRTIGPACILAALLFKPERKKAVGSGRESWR